jgi:rhombotail lipoprotein
LETALGEFQRNVKEGRAQVEIVHRAGYAGGGALDARTAGVMLVLFVLIAALYARRHLARRAQKKGGKES